MSETDRVDIPVSIDTEAAERNLRNLESAAESLDARLERLEQRGLRLANSLNIPDPDTGKAQKFESYSDVEGYFSNLSPNQVWSLSPKLGNTMAEIGAQRSMVMSRVAMFAEGNPLQVASTSGPALYNAYAAWQAPQPTGLGGERSSSETDRAAGTFATKFAQEFAKSSPLLGAAGLRTGLATTGLDSVTAAGDVLAGLVRPLTAALGEMAGPLGGAAALGSFGLSVNAEQASFNAAAQRLGVSTIDGSMALGKSLELQADTQGKDFNVHPDTAAKLATTLARTGMATREVIPNLTNTVAFARMLGLDEGQMGSIASLTGTLSTQAGMSPPQITRAYQDIYNGAGDSHQSVTKLVDALSTLEKATNGARVSIAGLTAAQKLLSSVAPGANIGQVIAPAAGASGGDAITMAAILGMSGDQFTRAQSHPDQLWDAASRLVQRTDRGEFGTQVSEMMLQKAGIDLSSLNPQQQASVINLLDKGDGTQAEKLASEIAKHTASQAKTPVEVDKAWAAATKDNTSAVNNLTAAVQNWWTHFWNDSGTVPAQINQRKDNQAFLGTTNPVATSPQTAYHEAAVHYATTGLVPASYNGPVVGGIGVPNIHGGTSFVPKDVMDALRSASKREGVPLAELAAQAAAEATNKHGVVDPSIAGGGLGQFTPDTMKYLTEQDKNSPFYHKKFDPYNVSQAATAMAFYDREKFNTYGSWTDALNAYNSGNPTVGYGQQVQNVALHLTATVDLRDTNGKAIPAATLRVTPDKPTVNVNRRPVAYQSYGPQHHTPPVARPRVGHGGHGPRPHH